MTKKKCGYYGTAIWKLDNPIENWLSYRADNSEFFKRIYVLYYWLFDRSYYKKGLQMISKVIEDFTSHNSLGDLPSVDWLVRDMIYSLHRYGADFQEYFIYEYYKRNAYGRNEFITNKMRYEYYYRLNGDGKYLLFEDKKNTYYAFSKYYGRDVLPIDTSDDRQKFLHFVSRHSEFMYKPVGGAEGRGIMKVNIRSDTEAKEFFNLHIDKGRYIVEEIIIQDECMSSLHRGSVNTVRVPAIISNGKVVIFHPFFRMGTGDDVVDNHGFGGIAASVDAETGIVYTPGLTRKGQWFLKHPDTGIQIVGFQLPKWGDLIELTNEITSLVEGIRYVGWDMAYTANGWIVVEGNALGSACSIQGQDKVGRKAELIRLIEQQNREGKR